jgi:FkbM family methyltransferase
MQKLKQKIINTNRYVSRYSLNFFSRFWNFVFILTNNSLRFKVSRNDTCLFISDTEHELYISQKERAWFYFKSINNRLESLGRMYFFDKIVFNNNDIIIDCGANIGEIYKSIKLFNNNNFYYYGFEPVLSEFKLVQLNTVNQISSPLALFSKNEFKKLYTYTAGADSTLIPDDRYKEDGDVECVRLDSISELKGKKIKLLKLEAEGAELDVLIGCRNILKNIEYISADLGFELDQGTRSNEAEVTEFLLSHNFTKLDSNLRHINLFKINN